MRGSLKNVQAAVGAVGSSPAESTVPAPEFCQQASDTGDVQRVHDLLGGRIVSGTLPYTGQCKHTGKVFGVGVFKTGTTSLSAELRQLGYASCAMARGWWGIGANPLIRANPLFFQNFDGPSLRRSIEANPLMREAVRAEANATLSATDAPWLFFFKVSPRQPRARSPHTHTLCGDG